MNTMGHPTHTPDSLYEQGVLAQTSGHLHEAIEKWREAIKLDPVHRPSLYNLAIALTLTGDENGTEELYDKLLILEPTHKNGLYNLANLKQRQGKNDKAEALYRRLTGIYPDFTAGWVNLAKIYSDSDRLEEAELLLNEAIRLNPTDIFAHWNLSHVFLKLERWEDGWREYEWRLELPNWLKAPVSAPAWFGEATQKRILLWNDQGLGDALQFLRYTRYLAERGHQVFVLVQKELKDIAATAPGVTQAFSPLDPLPEVDAQAPLLSMPYRLPHALPQTSWNGPYLFTKKTMTLKRNTGHIAVGLVWAGNQLQKNDNNRSAPLSGLKKLFEIDKIDWFSLQLGAAATQVQENSLSLRMTDLSQHLKDFTDTAAALSALDLIICVDTSIVHLCGALGRPIWLMLSTKHDWRWGRQETTNHWYPSLRIFKQEILGDWHSVSQQIAKELNKLV